MPCLWDQCKETGQVQTNGGDLHILGKSDRVKDRPFLMQFAASKMTSNLALKDWLMIANGGPNLTSPLIFVSLRSYLRDPATLRRNGCLFLELCSFGLGHVSTQKMAEPSLSSTTSRYMDPDLCQCELFPLDMIDS